MSSTPAALLLAAGFSRRFGADKRLHPIDGRPMLAVTAERYLSCFPTTCVVVRDDDHALIDMLSGLDVRIVRNPHAADGMSRSLAAGIAELEAESAVFVGLGDMPFVQARTLETLRDTLAKATPPAIVQPRFDGTPGHPVGFTRDYFARLAAATGDAGARSVVRDAGANLLRIDVDDEGVVRDVDRPSAA